MTTEQVARAAAFAALHRRGAGFILPNAWDAGSARILEQAGFPAIATTSAGIAFSHGVPDARLPWVEMYPAVARIVAAVEVPVTVDLESGYGDVAGSVGQVVAAGAVGANLEDLDEAGLLLSPESGAARIAEARAAAPAGTFILNARTDTYLTGHPDAFAESVRRAERYLDAGADCIFVPGVRDTDEIARLTAAIDAPVNVVAGLVEPVHDAATLRAAGVARISIGGTLTRAVLGVVERAAREMLDQGTFGFADGAPAYRDLQERFSR